MRRKPTEPEAWLWACLRGRRFGGAKFRRQRALGRYITDFCCDELKLVLELDGASHAQQREYDAERDALLAAAGYRVLRIANADVERDPETVLLRIIEEVRSAGENLFLPSPLERRAAEGDGPVPSPRQLGALPSPPEGEGPGVRGEAPREPFL